MRSARLILATSATLCSLAIAGCQLPFTSSQSQSQSKAQPLPPCVSPHPAAATTPDPQTTAAAREYQAFVDSTAQEIQSLNSKIRTHEDAGDVSAVKQDFRQAIDLGDRAAARLRSIRFPEFMTSEMNSYLDLIAQDRQAHQEYIDASDGSGRDAAIQHLNRVVRLEQNVFNQVRVDLGLAPFPCPYSVP